MSESENFRFWVRGIGIQTLLTRANNSRFDNKDLWDLAKQVESRGSINCVLVTKYEIPFFTDKWVSKLDRCGKVVCAVVGEDRLRVLVEPDLDTEMGQQLAWCKENEVSLYSFASGTVSRDFERVYLTGMGIVFNKSSISSFCDCKDDNGYRCERDVVITYPRPKKRDFGTARVGVMAISNEEAIILAEEVFFANHRFFERRYDEVSLIGFNKL